MQLLQARQSSKKPIFIPDPPKTTTMTNHQPAAEEDVTA
jgi:hypothetical protein